ncbi:MAG: DUF448 domain-containing protein [Armatimonadetes bacterium CG_4_10_14_0_8_um_filter_66_14]|nr:MAG: DUF448 domain-containing protein [Armatimonadetes bacterium CG_4_10_14_0_8_um_filter_66_14]
MSLTKHVPQRTCVGCRQQKSKRELIRVVRAPEGEVRLDLSGKAAGRGAYLCADAQCAALARKAKSLNRSLKCNVPEEFWGTLAERPVHSDVEQMDPADVEQTPCRVLRAPDPVTERSAR